MILGTGGDGGDGLLAGLVDAAGELAIGGVSPARRSRFIAGAGIALRLASPVTQVVAVTPGDRHQQGETGERTVPPPVPRSEEHTSELQSLMRISYAVFCLKKTTRHQ